MGEVTKKQLYYIIKDANHRPIFFQELEKEMIEQDKKNFEEEQRLIYEGKLPIIKKKDGDTG